MGDRHDVIALRMVSPIRTRVLGRGWDNRGRLGDATILGKVPICFTRAGARRGNGALREPGYRGAVPALAANHAPVAGLIAVEGPMTGAQASTGIDMADGAELAVQQINAAGGVDGVMLSLMKVDDKATPRGGIAAAHQAIAAHAFAVVGPFNSSVGVANLPLYKKAGLPIVRLTSSVKTEGFGVTAQPMDSQVAPVEVNEITKVLHAQRPAIIYDTSTYTAGIAAEVKSGLAKAGDPVVADLSVKSTQTSYTVAVRKAASSHPGLLYIAAYGTEAGAIAKAASNAGTGRCFVDLAAQGPDFVTAATQPVASSVPLERRAQRAAVRRCSPIRGELHRAVPHQPGDVGDVHLRLGRGVGERREAGRLARERGDHRDGPHEQLPGDHRRDHDRTRDRQPCPEHRRDPRRERVRQLCRRSAVGRRDRVPAPVGRLSFPFTRAA